MEISWKELPIYILKKHVNGQERKLTSETFPILPYEHQDKLDELEAMVADDSKTITDMYTFVKEAEIEKLIKDSEESILKMSKSQFFNNLIDAAYW